VSPRVPTVKEIYGLHGEKLRFLIVGFCNTATHYLLFVALLSLFGPWLHGLDSSSSRFIGFLGAHYYLVVQWASWVMMVPLATTTMRYFAFRSPGRLGRQILRAYFIYLPAQGLSTGSLWLTVSLLSLTPVIGQLITVGLVAIFSYVGHKYFTFRIPSKSREATDENDCD
jgi:putative flippase GtrA